MEAEGIVEPSKLEKIVLEDATAIKHKLDQTAAEVRQRHMRQTRAFCGAKFTTIFIDVQCWWRLGSAAVGTISVPVECCGI